MAEKTFNELVEDNFPFDSLLTQLKVEKLLQQVREATIVECKEIIQKNESGINALDKLPTDRITLPA